MNNFILYPALSSGISKFYFINNDIVSDNKSIRYYNDSNVNYPYFLLSAGHNFQFKNINENMQLNNAIVLGDSGGFQIVNDSKKCNLLNAPIIFDWLENNCNIGINLDIPVRNNIGISFDDCLNISYNNLMNEIASSSIPVAF